MLRQGDHNREAKQTGEQRFKDMAYQVGRPKEMDEEQVQIAQDTYLQLKRNAAVSTSGR